MADKVTYKVIDTEGNRLIVKYSKGAQRAVVQINWDGKQPIAQVLGMFIPFAADPDMSVNADAHLGLEGEAVPFKVQALPPPLTPAELEAKAQAAAKVT